MQHEHPPVQRTFDHCLAPSLDNYSLSSEDLPDERGYFLACCEFLVEASYSQRAKCVFTSPCPWVDELSRLFTRVQFFCFQSSTQHNYEPSNPGLGVTHLKHQLSPDTLRFLGDRHGHTPLLLISLCDAPERQLEICSFLDPNRSLLSITSVPEEFLSGTLYYPLYSPLTSSTCFLHAPHKAALRIYDPKVLKEEIGFFHLFTRCAGLYDGQAENGILTKYATHVLGYHPAHCWDAVSHARALVPR